MCCLTIVKTFNHKIVMTHNRDELLSRQTEGDCVREYYVNERKIWMPKDSLSNGTWIGSDGKRSAAILNGYKKNHHKKESYKVSRGTIIPQYFAEDTTDSFLHSFDPTGLEPFTLIISDNDVTITEYGWDENDIHIAMHDLEKPLIYSSYTLYESEIQVKRQNLFNSFITLKTDKDDLWTLHEKKGEGYGDFINTDYNSKIRTVAISQIVTGNITEFCYQSLVKNNNKQTLILI
jgi:hypothetical protein